MSLRFGIYPGGRGANEDGSMTDPDKPECVREALDALSGGRPLVLRCYEMYRPQGPNIGTVPDRPEQYLADGRSIDLVVCFRDPGSALTGWLAYLTELLQRYGSALSSLQVAEEPNHDGMGGDGGMPSVRRAVVEGVIHAKREAQRMGLGVQIGCNSTPLFGPSEHYWKELTAFGGADFVNALDYVALDFFADLVRPIPPDRLSSTVEGLLTGFREKSLAEAGIPAAIPLHVGENGWGTGPGHPNKRQTEENETIVTTIAGLADRLNLTLYEHFALRDAYSSVDDPFF